MNALVKKIMKRYSNRARLQLLKKMPVNAICAEIGVWKGVFSEDVLRTTQPEKLYLINPWMFQPDFADRWYGGALAKSQMDMDDIFSEVKERFASDARVTLKRDKSDSALSSFPDDYFDWVYIDGNHYFEYVLRDIELSISKTKAGGFICGDDLFWGEEFDFPVKRAVQEMVDKYKLSNVCYIKDQFIIVNDK